jgi:hypothetical protein
MQGHANCDNSLDMTYLPILLGYWSCYKRYMATLGYVVQMTAMGAFILMVEDSKVVDAGEYCSFPTYFNLWKCDFPNLKVSTSVRIAMHLQTATGILQITQWDAMMTMATTMATANVVMTDAAMTTTTMMAVRTFQMLESAQ